MRRRARCGFPRSRRLLPRATLPLRMLPDLKLAIRLQDIDNRLGDLSREIASLPVHIAEIEKKMHSHERRLEADRAALSANQKERKKCEGDIQMQEQKISKLKDQMLQAKTNDQYRAFQHEIEYCEKEIRKFEDRILELMGESEPLEKNVKAAEVSLKAERAQVESEKSSARERTAADQKAAAELHAERAEIVKQMTPANYQRYEKVRKARKGIGVAEVLEGRCSVCHMALRPQFFQDLRRGEQVMACESCTRILFYNPPVSIEDLAGNAVPAARQ
jgi:predicted  nucleic acid-binding Zn-ribbon protein